MTSSYYVYHFLFTIQQATQYRLINIALISKFLAVRMVLEDLANSVAMGVVWLAMMGAAIFQADVVE